MLLYYAPVLFAESIQVRIGRIAGQYAKPRSSGTEKIGDREVTSFRYVVTCAADIRLSAKLI